MRHARGAYWHGSQLSIEQARALCPHDSATSLQVTTPVMAAVASSATGLHSQDATGHSKSEEDLDRQDPWQFKNFRVT